MLFVLCVFKIFQCIFKLALYVCVRIFTVL